MVAWDCATANVHDTYFQGHIADFEDVMIILADAQFHAADGDPRNLKICPWGHWNDRMLIETVLSMLSTVCHLKKISRRVWNYVFVRLAWIMATFNILVQWHGLVPDENGQIHLSMAQFSL